jgi:hypothetical protein
MDGDISFLFPFHFDKREELDTSKPFQQNIEPWFGFDITTGTIARDVNSVHDESETSEISGSFAQDTSVSLKLKFDEESESGVTQGVADSQVQRFEFLSYNEEDLLDWDAAIITPPPRPSGTIRIKLRYKGRSKPFPIEGFWEE